ncbi:uncharacterized protein LOC143281665 [Babylonia areolata]|uniref:uncharacterized protein LOC143281665 n=1 Tax=Babylonia areolata TaxID=304850 RepID=UPI003FD57807
MANTLYSNEEPFSCEGLNVSLDVAATPSGAVRQELEKHEGALLLLLGFGGFSVALALGYNAIRRHVFGEVNSLDTAFDAGGRVTMSLTAVTVGVQLLWPADLLQSATVTSKMGIAGAFWYSTAVVVNIILFPLLSLQFKTRAPGAKTYLQVVRARFGRGTHIVFCCFALLTNITILTAIIISGNDLFQALIKDVGDEFSVLVMAALFGSYSFVGGLGSTFYVSYFNAFTVFVVLAVFVVRVFYLPLDQLPFGDLQTVYRRMTCLQGPQGNLDRSFVTFWSADAMVWMVQGVFVAASVTFCDQAAWQSRIAAKPVQGVLGFYGATLLWFAIPSTLGTTGAITYLSFTAGNATLVLPASDVDAGLVVPYVAQQAMGRAGALMILTMFTMLMMSTGSGEVMGVSSIIVYDVFQSYVCPFRPGGTKPGQCILCDKEKKETAADSETRDTGDSAKRDKGDTMNHVDACTCPSVKDCAQCSEDLEAARSASGMRKEMVKHSCTVHGEYRTYQDALVRVKSWTILWVSLAIVPYGLLMIRSGIDLNWVFLTGCVMTVPCFPGVVISIVWVKATGKAMVLGAVTGLICGVTATIARASRLPGGLGDFLANTSEGYTVMAGACTSFLVALVVTIVVSLLTHSVNSDDDRLVEWQKVRDIDNPLNPWVGFYREEFSDLHGQQRPSYQQLTTVFRKAKVIAIVGSVLGLLLFVVFIPGVMASLRVLDEHEFTSWVMTMHVWCFFMAAIVIIVTPLEEVRTIWRELRRRRVYMKRHYDQFEQGSGEERGTGEEGKNGAACRTAAVI